MKLELGFSFGCFSLVKTLCENTCRKSQMSIVCQEMGFPSRRNWKQMQYRGFLCGLVLRWFCKCWISHMRYIAYAIFNIYKMHMRYIAYAFCKCCISQLWYIAYAFCKCYISHMRYLTLQNTYVIYRICIYPKSGTNFVRAPFIHFQYRIFNFTDDSCTVNAIFISRHYVP